MKVVSLKTKISVGAFIVVVLTGAIVALLTMGEGLPGLTEYRHYRLAFRDASGLQEGAPVRMGGLEVGYVRRLDLELIGGTPTAIADIDVREPYFKLIRTNAIAQLQTQGVLGDKFVTIMGGHVDAPEAPDGYGIATMAQFSMEELSSRANQILNDVEVILRGVRAFSEGLPSGDALASIVTEFAQSSRAFQSVGVSLASTGGVVSVLGAPQSGELLAKSLTNLATLSERIDKVLRKIETGQGTAGLLVNDPSLYDDARALLGRANRNRIARTLVQEVVRQPEQSQEPPRR